MKRFQLASLVLCLAVVVPCTVAGCGPIRTAADWLFGVSEDKDGEVKKDPAGGAAGSIGSILSFFVPGADTILVAIAGIYASLRAKKWKDAFVSTAEAVIEFKKTPQGLAVWEDLKARFGAAHADAKIQEFVNAALAKIKFEAAVAPVPAPQT